MCACCAWPGMHVCGRLARGRDAPSARLECPDERKRRDGVTRRHSGRAAVVNDNTIVYSEKHAPYRAPRTHPPATTRLPPSDTRTRSASSQARRNAITHGVNGALRGQDRTHARARRMPLNPRSARRAGLRRPIACARACAPRWEGGRRVPWQGSRRMRTSVRVGRRRRVPATPGAVRSTAARRGPARTLRARH